MEKEVYFCSARKIPSYEDMQLVIKNPTDKSIHFCIDPIEAGKYERCPDEKDGDCIGRKDGSFWIMGVEYGDVQVRFCPHCGIKAPKQTESDTD